MMCTASKTHWTQADRSGDCRQRSASNQTSHCWKPWVCWEIRERGSREEQSEGQRQHWKLVATLAIQNHSTGRPCTPPGSAGNRACAPWRSSRQIHCGGHCHKGSDSNRTASHSCRGQRCTMESCTVLPLPPSASGASSCCTPSMCPARRHPQSDGPDDSRTHHTEVGTKLQPCINNPSQDQRLLCCTTGRDECIRRLATTTLDPLTVVTIHHRWRRSPVEDHVHYVELIEELRLESGSGSMLAAERNRKGLHPKAFAITVIGVWHKNLQHSALSISWLQAFQNLFLSALLSSGTTAMGSSDIMRWWVERLRLLSRQVGRKIPTWSAPTQAPGIQGEFPRFLTHATLGEVLFPVAASFFFATFDLLLHSLLLCKPLLRKLLLLRNRALLHNIPTAPNAASIKRHRALHRFLAGRELHNVSSASVFSPTNQSTRIPGVDCQFVEKGARTIRRRREVCETKQSKQQVLHKSTRILWLWCLGVNMHRKQAKHG